MTTEQFRTLFCLGAGPSRCAGGNPSHTALLRKGWISVRWISRREYVIARTPAGEEALARELSRKAKQKSSLHT
jgi:hypothetical protein